MKVARPVRWEPVGYLSEVLAGDPTPPLVRASRFDSGFGHQRYQGLA